MTTEDGSGVDPWAGLDAWRAITRANAVLTRVVDEQRARAGLGAEDLGVLLPLADAPERRMRMHELAVAANLTRSGLTRRIDRLESAGLVRREPCDTDGRGAYTALTPEGLAALDAGLPDHAEALRATLAASLGAAGTDELLDLLERLEAAEAA